MAEICVAEIGVKARHGQNYPIGVLGLVGAVVGYESVNDLVWNILGRKRGNRLYIFVREGYFILPKCAKFQSIGFFASFYVLFRAFSSETRAFSCHKVHISHVVQTCKWSRLWSDLKSYTSNATSHEPQAQPEVDFLLLPL